MALELVTIGASAGGLNALLQILSPLRAGYPLAITVVQHRGLDDDGGYLALLSQSLALPACEVEDKQTILPGRVYIAPADYHLLVDGRSFALSTDPRVNSARPSIDVLFESAAESYRDRLLAVLLTGASHDGSRGAAHVRQRGGQVVVQDPDEAQVPVMPRAALPHADRILKLEEITRHLEMVAYMK